MDDARLSVGFPGHPKTKKLIRRLGEAGAFRLVCLILWAAANRPSGDLSGMSIEDIELAADWRGDPDAFVGALVGVHFLEGEEGGYRLHDWAEHQPWAAGADLRSAKARWNAICRHHGEEEADQQVPEWATARHATSKKNDAGSTKKRAASKNAPKRGAESRPSNGAKDAASTENDAASSQNDASSNAPSPSPSPLERESEARGQVAELGTYGFEPPPEHRRPLPESVTAATRAAVLMRAAGCASANAYHPGLLEALSGGVSPEALEATAVEGINTGKTDPFRWACTTALNRRVAAQAAAQTPGAKNHAKGSQSGRVRGQSLADAAEFLHAADDDCAAGRPQPAAGADDYLEGTSVRIVGRA